MNDKQIQPINEKTLVRLISVLVRQKKKVFLINIGVMILTFTILFFSDKWYESQAVIVPPSNSGTPLDVLAGGLSGLGSSILGVGAVDTDRYVAILNSRRLREDFIRQYDLMTEFDIDRIEVMLEKLDKMLLIESDRKLKTITVTFEFKNDPIKTAEMANYIVKKLDEINRELSTEQARSSRSFIERRYNQAMFDLKISEDSLNVFQKKYGVIEISEQTSASIKAASEIYALLAGTEIEFNMLSSTLGDNHPEITKLKSKIHELQKEKIKLESGSGGLGILIPFDKTPDLALSYYRLYRNIQINTKIVEFLVPQYEQAKIQEAKDTPTLLILDNAHPATKHSKPKKVLYTLAVGILTFGLIVSWFFVQIKLKEDNEFSRYYRHILQILKG